MSAPIAHGAPTAAPAPGAAGQVALAPPPAIPGSHRRGRSRFDSVVLKPATPVHDFDEWRGIWVIVEQREGRVRDVTFELLGAARPMAKKLGAPVTAVLLCGDAGDMPAALVARGADAVLVVEHAWLRTPLARPSADVMTDLIQARKPEIVLIGATHTGRDVSSRIAVTVEAGMTADCTELDVEPGSRELLARRPAFGGKMLATIRCDRHRPQMATARPGIFLAPGPDASRTGEVEKVRIPWLDERTYAAEILDYVVEEGVDITKADVLVCGGLGVGPDGWPRLHALAQALGGEVACTRPVADAGWAERARQVGQTGVSVRPKLYVAVGLSGAIQHIEGMKESGTVIAINADPNAPIFQYADVGIVADWRGVVDDLTQEATARGLAQATWKYPHRDTLADDREAAVERAEKKAKGPAADARDEPATTPTPRTPQATHPSGATTAPTPPAPSPALDAPPAIPSGGQVGAVPAAPDADVDAYPGAPTDKDAVRAWVEANVAEERKAWVFAADCIVCNGCEAACPTGAAIVTDTARVDRDLCIADGACFDVCPTDAIRPGVEDPATTTGWPEGSRLAGQAGA